MVNATQGVLLERCVPAHRSSRPPLSRPRFLTHACAGASRRSDVQMTQFVVSMNEQQPTRYA